MNLKTKTNTVKQILARVMLVVVLLLGTTTTGCIFPKEDPVILDKEIPNLDEQPVSYLMIRNLNKCDYVTDVDYLHYSINGGFEIKNRESIYDPAIIEVGAGFDADGLYKKSNFIYLTNSVSMSIMCHFYPVKGDIGELKYEFKYVDASPYKYNKVVYIYNNSQLVGKFYYDVQATVKESWIEKFLNDNLILMTVKNYTDIEKSFDNTEENITSYLSVGNIANSQYCSDVVSYSSKVEGGLDIEYGSEYYSNITNVVNLNFDGDESINNSNISIQAEFYEYKGVLGLLRYEIGDNSTISIYNGDTLVGEIDVDCANSISDEWIEKFLNDNLIVTELKNR